MLNTTIADLSCECLRQQTRKAFCQVQNSNFLSSFYIDNRFVGTRRYLRTHIGSILIANVHSDRNSFVRVDREFSSLLLSKIANFV